MDRFNEPDALHNPDNDLPRDDDLPRADGDGGPTAGSPPAPTFDDVMVDIETMSLSPSNALILSIGMLEFNPRADSTKCLFGEKRIFLPNLNEQMLLGREVEASTQKFWAGQSAAASDHWKSAQTKGCAIVCDSMALFLAGKKRVWANGIVFDLGNLDSFYRQVTGKGAPWAYNAARDMRTICNEVPNNGRALPYGTLTDMIPHHPVSDCILQAWRVWEHSSWS